MWLSSIGGMLLEGGRPKQSEKNLSKFLFIFLSLSLFRRNTPQWTSAPSFTRFLDHTYRRATVGRNALNEWSLGRRDLYLTTHNSNNRQTSMSPVGFEPTVSAGKLLQTYALDRAATGTGPPQIPQVIWDRSRTSKLRSWRVTTQSIFR